jgi:hypothetical protein
MGDFKQFSFSPKTQEELNNYVYMLVDPRDNKVFYVGKGQGNRAFDHARNALKEADGQNDKSDIIKSILKDGKEVLIYIVRHGLADEKTAFEIESTLIDLFSENHWEAKLANIQKGHEQKLKGIETAEEIEKRYSAPELNLEKLKASGKKIIFIKINKTYDILDSYTATRISWPVNIRRANKADYIVSVYHGLIVAIFKADENGWRPYEPKPKRNFFEGYEVAQPFRNKDDEQIYSALYGKLLPKSSRKQQLPFGYLPKD